MKKISTMLREESKSLEEIIKNAQGRMKKAPDGRLRISGKRKKEEYYVKKDGERVRSKSEKIIADKLYSLGIPYRYEYPLCLEGNVIMYPDFTILKVEEQKEIYLEHFGKMDDTDYLNTVLFKLHTYERNGIHLGINLFFTYETAMKPLNTRTLNEFLRKLFC